MRRYRLPLCFPLVIFLGCLFVLPSRGDVQSRDNAFEAQLFEQAEGFQPHNRLDELLLESLVTKDITPAPLCSDAVFVRRIYLDLIGTLPTVSEVRDFLDDTSPDKRNVLIDQLLARPEFVDYWTMKWCDVLRVKAEFPINLWPNGALNYYNWIRNSVRTNKPYDQFARELLTSDGSNFRNGAVNFFRAVPEKNAERIAEAVAQTFLGMRTAHWSEEKRTNLAVFFSRVAYKDTAEWKEEIVFWDRRPLECDSVIFPDGTGGSVPPNTDPRRVFADWLTAPENTAFSRCMANRTWFWLFGYGLVHEPDDFRDTNPPVHPELLDHLADEFVRSGYDFKHLLRYIVRSATYQQSSLARGDAKIALGMFAVYPIRRLEAEVLQDALAQIFGNPLGFTNEVAEPFTHIPPRYRSILLHDASITSPFLEMFGRSTRDTGSTADRNNQVTDTQQLFLLNSNEINNWARQLGQNQMNEWQNRPNAAAEIVEALWLLILSRPASSDERQIATDYIAPNGRLNNLRVQDLVWALINTDEFLCRR